MKKSSQKTRFQELYDTNIRPQLKDTLAITNIMDVPKVSKIVLNIGVKGAVGDSKELKTVMTVLEKIAGQKPIKTLAKKSIAGFKLREGMAIGTKVTLRSNIMYEFLDRLINLSLPKVRDFQGVTTNLDRRGNYNLGIKDWVIFPEVDYTTTDKSHGLNVTIHTTAKNDEHGFELIKSFGMPFRKK